MKGHGRAVSEGDERALQMDLGLTSGTFGITKGELAILAETCDSHV